MLLGFLGRYLISESSSGGEGEGEEGWGSHDSGDERGIAQVEVGLGTRGEVVKEVEK